MGACMCGWVCVSVVECAMECASTWCRRGAAWWWLGGEEAGGSYPANCQSVAASYLGQSSRARAGRRMATHAQCCHVTRCWPGGSCLTAAASCPGGSCLTAAVSCPGGSCLSATPTVYLQPSATPTPTAAVSCLTAALPFARQAGTGFCTSCTARWWTAPLAVGESSVTLMPLYLHPD